jgi:hypothetical protein
MPANVFVGRSVVQASITFCSFAATLFGLCVGILYHHLSCLISGFNRRNLLIFPTPTALNTKVTLAIGPHISKNAVAATRRGSQPTITPLAVSFKIFLQKSYANDIP